MSVRTITTKVEVDARSVETQLRAARKRFQEYRNEVDSMSSRSGGGVGSGAFLGGGGGGDAFSEQASRARQWARNLQSERAAQRANNPGGGGGGAEAGGFLAGASSVGRVASLLRGAGAIAGVMIALRRGIQATNDAHAEWTERIKDNSSAMMVGYATASKWILSFTGLQSVADNLAEVLNRATNEETKNTEALTEALKQQADAREEINKKRKEEKEEADKRNQQIEDEIKGMELEAALVGKSAAAAAELVGISKKWTEAQRDRAIAAAEAKEQAEALVKEEERLKDIHKEALSPLEKYTATMEDFIALRGQLKLSYDEFERLSRKAADTYDQESGAVAELNEQRGFLREEMREAKAEAKEAAAEAKKEQKEAEQMREKEAGTFATSFDLGSRFSGAGTFRMAEVEDKTAADLLRAIQTTLDRRLGIVQ